MYDSVHQMSSQVLVILSSCIHIPDCPKSACRILKCMQNAREVSIHDIMDDPWPTDETPANLFEEELAEAVRAGRLLDMTIYKVGV